VAAGYADDQCRLPANENRVRLRQSPRRQKETLPQGIVGSRICEIREQFGRPLGRQDACQEHNQLRKRIGLEKAAQNLTDTVGILSACRYGF
jgi:hypothetical protein